MSADVAHKHTLTVCQSDTYVTSSPPQVRHVLIVEDEKDLSELLSYNLHRAGYLVAHAPTGLNSYQGLKITN